MQLSPTNFDSKNILMSESMKMTEKKQITDKIKGRKEPKLCPGPGNSPKKLQKLQQISLVGNNGM